MQSPGIVIVDPFQLSPMTCPLISHFLFYVGKPPTPFPRKNNKKLGSETRICWINADTMKNNQDMPLWLLM